MKKYLIIFIILFAGNAHAKSFLTYNGGFVSLGVGLQTYSPEVEGDKKPYSKPYANLDFKIGGILNIHHFILGIDTEIKFTSLEIRGYQNYFSFEGNAILGIEFFNVLLYGKVGAGTIGIIEGSHWNLPLNLVVGGGVKYAFDFGIAVFTEYTGYLGLVDSTNNQKAFNATAHSWTTGVEWQF